MKTQKDNLKILVEKAMQFQGRTHMRPVIEKELLHYDILFSLDKEGLLDELTFQGGTSLRLCYGASRFSEDLDFAGGKNFQASQLMQMKKCIENYLGERSEIDVSVKEPKDMKTDPKNAEIKISKWQIRIETQPEKKELPKQMIKIEVCNVPSYTREPKQLQHNYDFLPDGYQDTLILVESLDEIMADKIISFVNCQSYIRYRDIWDLYWLKQQKAIIIPDLITKKIKDYKIETFNKKLIEKLEKISDIILGKEFRDQMVRFISSDVQERTLQKEKFYIFLVDEIKNLLNNLHFF